MSLPRLLRPLSPCFSAFTNINNGRRASCSLMTKRKSPVGGNIESRHSPKARKMTTPATATIDLSDKEAQLKALLLDACEYVNKTQKLAEPLVLRWAGGWVRDKLLGIESHDIDTAINLLTGEAFSRALVKMCEEPDVIAKHKIQPTDIGGLHKILANPEKSKHLETITVKLFGYDMDFVNLRKETYATDSRNPRMEFGTAEEDALRRDATVNSLFYNLNTGLVEDFIGGLADMENKLIRTPMDPLTTFTDDPLRVLRLVRFASRLGFSIDAAAEKSMGDPRVREALCLKISRERVGNEVEKMLKGPHPKRALELIDTLGLYHVVFTDPANAKVAQPDTSKWRIAYGCLDEFCKNKTPGSIYDVLVPTDEAAYYAWNLAALCPWQLIQAPEAFTGRKAPPPPPTLVVREGTKGSGKFCNFITATYLHREEITALKRAVCNKEPETNQRDHVGMAIRKWEGNGQHWKLQVLSALLCEAMEVAETPQSSLGMAFLAGWQAFLDHLQELDLMDAPAVKSPVDGTGLANALGVKPGGWMKPALDVCMAWQLRNPDVTDPDGAIEEVRKRAIELKIPM